VSHPILRRRFRRACALTIAIGCAALVAPAAALADGQLDTSFNGTGYHVGTAAEGLIFNNVENRIPMVVQSDGKIVAGGSRGGFMALVRYNVNGTIDTSFGTGGFATRQFAGTPTAAGGTSGAVAMTQDASGNLIVAGFGGAQSMVVARFTAAGVYSASAVCFAPHLIDYAARAVAVKPDGSIVLAGYGRDRHASAAVPPTGPSVVYGLRAVVTLPASGNSATACGTYSSANGLSLGSNGVALDGLNPDGSGADPARAGRMYDGVVALPDNRYVVATTSGPDGTAWVQRYSATGNGTLDTTFAGGRVSLSATSLHALALLGDGSVLAAGETLDAAVSANRQMLVAKIGPTGALAAFGTGGVAHTTVAGGTDSGQAIAVQSDGSILVGGQANLAGKSAFALTRFTAGGVRDDTFGNHGQTVTPFGAPAVNGYITGMALSGNLLSVAGRLTDPGGLAVVAARYFATGAPPPPPPPAAASTLKIDGITNSGAHITGSVNANGTASNWWLEYGTTTAFGTKTAQVAVSGTNDIDVGVTLTGLNSGTLYHVRFVIANGVATTPGDDLTFTTLGSPGANQAGNTPGTGAKKFCKVPRVVGKKLNPSRRKILRAGCKVKVVYKKSKRPKGIVLKQSRKAGKKLGYRAVVKLTVAVKHPVKKH
jgi:uncharacterized delta-60 repeat protein